VGKTHKNHKERAQDDKLNKKRGESDVPRQGECGLTLQGSPFGRNLSDVQKKCHVRDRKNTLARTRRMDVRTNQSYRTDNQNHCPDIQEKRLENPSHREDASHKKSKKERKKSKKIFPK
jgi:hypothetical protein